MTSRFFSVLLFLIGILFFLGSCRDNGVNFDEIPDDSFWETASPSSQDMDGEKIGELESSLKDASGLYSFLIIRNGKIVSETYRNGASKNALLHLRSVTKAVTGLLIAKLIYDGPLESTDKYITDFFS